MDDPDIPSNLPPPGFEPLFRSSPFLETVGPFFHRRNVDVAVSDQGLVFSSESETVSENKNCRYCLMPHAGRLYATEKNISHLPRQRVRVGVNLWLVPGINPVHHSKEAQHGDAAGKLQPTFQL